MFHLIDNLNIVMIMSNDLRSYYAERYTGLESIKFVD